MIEQNPYAPPRAPVSDVDNSAQPPYPRHVETACRLWWISVWLVLPGSVITVFRSQGIVIQMGNIIDAMIMFGINYAIVGWITRKLRAGRNWMRWLLTTLSVISWLTVPVFWAFYVKVFTVLFAEPISAISIIVQFLIGIPAIVLLHTPSSRQWFRGSAAA